MRDNNCSTLANIVEINTFAAEFADVGPLIAVRCLYVRS